MQVSFTENAIAIRKNLKTTTKKCETQTSGGSFGGLLSFKRGYMNNKNSKVWVYASSTRKFEHAWDRAAKLTEQAKADGYSIAGTSAEVILDDMPRTALKEAMNSIRKGDCGAIYTDKLSRIDSSEFKMLMFLIWLMEHNAKIITSDGHLPYKLATTRIGHYACQYAKARKIAYGW